MVLTILLSQSLKLFRLSRDSLFQLAHLLIPSPSHDAHHITQLQNDMNRIEQSLIALQKQYESADIQGQQCQCPILKDQIHESQADLKRIIDKTIGEYQESLQKMKKKLASVQDGLLAQGQSMLKMNQTNAQNQADQEKMLKRVNSIDQSLGHHQQENQSLRKTVSMLQTDELKKSQFIEQDLLQQLTSQLDQVKKEQQVMFNELRQRQSNLGVSQHVQTQYELEIERIKEETRQQQQEKKARKAEKQQKALAQQNEQEKLKQIQLQQDKMAKEQRQQEKENRQRIKEQQRLMMEQQLQEYITKQQEQEAALSMHRSKMDEQAKEIERLKRMGEEQREYELKMKEQREREQIMKTQQKQQDEQEIVVKQQQLQEEEKHLEVEIERILEKRVSLGQRVYKNLTKNEYIGDGKKISRVNRFTQLLAQFAKSIALSHKVLLSQLTEEDKEKRLLDLLDKAHLLDQGMNLNQQLWEGYQRQTIEMHGSKIRKRGSMDNINKNEDPATLVKILVFDPLHNNCKNFFEQLQSAESVVKFMESGKMLKETQYIGEMMMVVRELKDKSLCNISQNQEVFSKVLQFMEEQTTFLKEQQDEERRLEQALRDIRGQLTV